VYLERTPELSADDPALLAALAVFAPVDHERLAAHLPLLTGRAERQWTLGDFMFRRRTRREWDDEAVAGMLSFISPQYYDAAATLELTPAWLGFLERQGLLTAEQRGVAQTDLHKLVADATVGPNIRRAWEQA
jgi:hypothetical protein